MNPIEKDAGRYALIGFVCVMLILCLLSFYAGMRYERKPELTWVQVISNMPPQLKRDIAIDYCVAHRGLCQRLPMKSPINPMDVELK